MSEELWQIRKHIIPASYVRGFDRGVRENRKPWLRLAVNHYTPRQPSTNENAFTLIVAQGIGSAKECYEPLFDDLLVAGIPIRGVWIADSASNGESYLLNEDTIGDEPAWTDYSRDIWAMINHFQAEMPPPLVGVGQSLGCGNLLLLASWHPRLFDGILAMEPALGPSEIFGPWPAPDRFFPGVMAAHRKDNWPSRAAARAALKKNRYYGLFDDRVFEKVIQYELVDVGDKKAFGKASSSHQSAPVTLTTPKHIETYHWMLADPPLPNHKPVPEINQSLVGRKAVPGFHRADAFHMFQAVPLLYPPVLLVWATGSLVSRPQVRAWWREKVGTGLTGGGGSKVGAVTEVVVEHSTHPVCLEKPRELAVAAQDWFKKLGIKVENDFAARAKQASFMNEIQPALAKRLEKL